VAAVARPRRRGARDGGAADRGAGARGELRRHAQRGAAALRDRQPREAGAGLGDVRALARRGRDARRPLARPRAQRPAPLRWRDGARPRRARGAREPRAVEGAPRSVTRDDWDRLFHELYLRTYAKLARGGDPESEALGFARL